MQTQQSKEDAARDEQERQDERRARWWTVWLTGILVLVGLGTGIVVGWQAWETRQSVMIAGKSIEQTERHFALQNAQWLDISNVHVQAVPATDRKVGFEWQVRFRIDNKTSHPVRVEAFELYVEGNFTFVHQPRTITPNGNFRPVVPATSVAAATVTALNASRDIRVGVWARVTYTNALEKRVTQCFAREGLVSTWKLTRLKRVIPGGDNEARFNDLRAAHSYVAAHPGKDK